MASEKCKEISCVCNRAAEHPPAGNLNFEQGKHRVRKANMHRQQSFLSGPRWPAQGKLLPHSGRAREVARAATIRCSMRSFNVEGNGYIGEPPRDAGRHFGRRTAL